MDFTLNNVVSILSIITFACGAIHYVVIRPVQASIDTLCKAVSELRALIKNLENKSHVDALETEKRLTKAESSIKSAHHRIDGLEEEKNVGSI